MSSSLNNAQRWIRKKKKTFLKVRNWTKGHCVIVSFLWWVGHHAESSITTSKRRRESVEDVLIREYHLLSISASTPRVIPTALPPCPPLFASQQSLNRWCSAWESSDSHRLATNRLLGNQLTRLDSARCCHHIFLGDEARVPQ